MITVITLTSISCTMKCFSNYTTMCRVNSEQQPLEQDHARQHGGHAGENSSELTEGGH